MYNHEQLAELSVAELREIARTENIKGIGSMRKANLVEAIISIAERQTSAQQADAVEKVHAPANAKVEPAEHDAGAARQRPRPERPKQAPQPRRTRSAGEQHRPALADTEEKPSANKQRPTDVTEVKGFLEVLSEGYGFIRFENYESSANDVYVSNTQIRRFNLKTGDEILGDAKKTGTDERFAPLLYVHRVNGDTLDVSIKRKPFDSLTPIYPTRRLHLETAATGYSMRLIDLMAPIGYGQRGLIVAPPKAGKTTLLKGIAQSISKNHPDVELIVLLVDERPEEVTDMKRSIDGEVIYSTFDETPEHHAKIAELVLERAQRLVEHKKDVVILLDSLTRLARAYNLIVPPTGRTLSGGLDPAALHKPKRFFGAARNIEEGGSLTILATALVETGSRMDEVIFEEFKGTGNMELRLDRQLQERRVFPAVDISRSGTRREEVLLNSDELAAVWAIRKAMGSRNNLDVTEEILSKLTRTKTNQDFVQNILDTMGR